MTITYPKITSTHIVCSLSSHFEHGPKLSPVMHLIVSVGIAIAIAYGSHLIITGQITSGNFVSFIAALILLYTPVKNIGNNLNLVQFSFFAKNFKK